MLVVDDDPLILRLLRTVLTEAGYVCREAADAVEADAQMRQQSFDLVVCDVAMPGRSGIDLARSIRQRNPATAILMVTASGDTGTAQTAYEAGADGYLTKPFRVNDVLIAAIGALRHRALIGASPDGERAARPTDPLTGLPAASLADSLIEEALERAGAAGGEVAVVLVNIDRFALINAALGRAFGDAVLVEVARRLSDAAQGCAVARLAADEFLVLHEELRAASRVHELVERALAALRGPLVIEGRQLAVTASAGIAVAPAGAGRPEALIRDAGIALRQAKEGGGNQPSVFEIGMRDRWAERLNAEIALRRALDHGQFRLFYQPVADLRTGRLVGFEALLRWQHPEEGIVAPSRFIPVAEETGLIVELGAWVIEEACRQLSEWKETAAADRGPVVSVNVSARQFAEPEFMDSVGTTLRETGVGPGELAFEITESQLVAAGAPTGALAEARELGIALLLDDFGTGYSSLGYLKRFPVSALKIDRSFIAGLPEDDSSLALVHAILAMAGSLGIEVVAEGLETGDQLRLMQSLACHFGQGFLLGRPMTAAVATQLLRESPSWFEQAARDGAWPTVHDAVHGRLRPPAARRGERPPDGERIGRFTRRATEGSPVQPTSPPERPLPSLANLLRERGHELAGATARELYAGPGSGWFATEEAGAAISRWLDTLAEACDTAAYDPALAALGTLMERAYVHGTTLLERHRFLDLFREVAMRAANRHGGSPDELMAARRLFASLGQSVLES